MYRQFKVPGIYLSDIKKFTGYSDVKGVCEKLGIRLYILYGNVYNPLGIKDVYKIIKWIRAHQWRQPELF